MAIDLTRFIATFFDETQEHLESIEERVMTLAASNDDPEVLNAIFRAAHSIKGGSGTFGFTQLTETTHELETLFDGMRKGNRRADAAMVRLLLDASDALKAHVARLKRGDRTGDPAMDALRVRLEGYRSGTPGTAGAAAQSKAAAPGASSMNVFRARAADPARASEIDPVLAQTLASFGDVIGGEGGVFRVVTPRGLEDLNESLAFALAPEDFVIEAEAAPAKQGERYGLFDVAEAAPEPAGEKYGLFEPLPVAEPVAPAAPAASSGEKYGLFESQQESEAKEKEQARARGDQSSIRVSTEKIDRIVNLVGELVIAQAMLQQAAGGADTQEERLSHSLGTLDRNTRELQQAVMSIRMMPMEFVFSRFPRLVYDVSARLGKKVQLRTQGHETELDKELIELLVDPLTHVVRNAIDHGIESPEERVRAGKPEQGSVHMRATHRGGSVIIEVTDDGRGLDRVAIVAKGRELGMAVSEDMPDTEIWQVLFAPGFSTAKQVTELSGRGVGMDVVRRNINSLGGSVYIASEFGQGTTITIQLPLTLAVLDGMIVSVADENYIVPLEFVSEAFRPGPADIKKVVNQAAFVAVRGEHLPIIRLEDVVEAPQAQRLNGEPLCLVVEVDQRRAALLVDGLVGQQQLVVKSLETNLHHVPGVAGATILGDGRVALILDVAAITRRHAVTARSAA
ncbi:chemotaxis protein CheA [Usitatibacter palustris]|uniref:Chemotaxis protein CheA n=1 Tax=Usitatibacter palustris TaxID=2732487 RepID=A0A6M4H9G1_9PROT|nr:chemotaxis protein CheA [Usitatibacter palustris]QJR15034.1 Chemotaxis protein CheA [Usitatibacter palustris]